MNEVTRDEIQQLINVFTWMADGVTDEETARIYRHCAGIAGTVIQDRKPAPEPKPTALNRILAWLDSNHLPHGSSVQCCSDDVGIDHLHLTVPSKDGGVYAKTIDANDDLEANLDKWLARVKKEERSR